MTRFAAAASLLALAIGLAAAGTARAADKASEFHLKPGASGSICLSCHVDFQETIRRPHVHTPVKAGDCADCHDPHASDHGKLLEAAPDKICLTCHEGIVPDEPLSIHRAVAEGHCVDCHDPHASDFPNQLRAEGNQLCLGCHDGLAKAIEAAEYRHAPVETNCLRCHTPHASAEARSLLKRDVPGLCLQCHDWRKPAFQRAHLDYPVAQSNCVSCHDPHGSKNRGILWADVHPPVARKLCVQCHAPASGTEPLATRRPGAELCRGCHNDLFNDELSRSRLHWPVLDQRACANCHNPHASKTSFLLAQPPGKLCGSCHEDAVRRTERSLSKHPPNAEGDCTTCHEPHGANVTFLLIDHEIELCGTCHDWGQHAAHPMGDKILDPRDANLTVGCLSCHRVHGTQYPNLTYFDPKQELCMQCHTQFSR